MIEHSSAGWKPNPDYDESKRASSTPIKGVNHEQKDAVVTSGGHWSRVDCNSVKMSSLEDPPANQKAEQCRSKSASEHKPACGIKVECAETIIRKYLKQFRIEMRTKSSEPRPAFVDHLGIPMTVPKLHAHFHSFRVRLVLL